MLHAHRLGAGTQLQYRWQSCRSPNPSSTRSRRRYTVSASKRSCGCGAPVPSGGSNTLSDEYKLALASVLQHYGKDSSYKPGLPIEMFIKEELQRRSVSEQQMQDELLAARTGTAITITQVMAKVRSPQEKLKVLTKLVNEVRQGLRASPQWRQLQATMAAAASEAGPSFTWSSVTHLVTYCLGSVELSDDYLRGLESGGAPVPPQPLDKLGPGWYASCSLWQLAFALELAAFLPGLKGKPQFYDPCMSPLDRRLVVAAGGELLHEDERGAHHASEPTLLYMPACPVPMYQYLLEANVGSTADGTVNSGTVNSMAAAWGEEAGGDGSGPDRFAGLRNLVVLGTSVEYLCEHAKLVQQPEGATADVGSSRSAAGSDSDEDSARETEAAADAADAAADDDQVEIEDDMMDRWLDADFLQEVLQHGGVAAYEIPDFALLHANSVARLTLFDSAKAAAARQCL